MLWVLQKIESPLAGVGQRSGRLAPICLAVAWALFSRFALGLKTGSFLAGRLTYPQKSLIRRESFKTDKPGCFC